MTLHTILKRANGASPFIAASTFTMNCNAASSSHLKIEQTAAPKRVFGMQRSGLAGSLLVTATAVL